ncbi:MAG: hypothetical protein FD163_577 [Hyphomonadaceae bacterium]|nr:MAG: hypothetical protein FD128_2077 [Hyphomonadaceae bacterium]KAF0185909.1 MAG: hypothetical protein FD163_577 [Hyphomonadaceae bacterium]
MKKFIAISAFMVLAIPNIAYAVACPGAPASTLGTINYDPLATTATTANFTLTILPSNLAIFPSDLGFDQRLRAVTVVKQVEGGEDEGIRFSFESMASSSFSIFGDETFNGNASSYSTWRINGARDRALELGFILATQSGIGSFQISIPAGQNLSAGAHVVEYLSRGYWEELYNTQTCPYGSGGDTAIEVKTFTINVQSSMSLNMTGGGVTGLIDFDNQGGLATNASRSTSVRARSSVPYKITMDSAYNGYLNLDNSPTAIEKIAYTAKLGNVAISEAAPYIVNTATGTNGLDLDLPFEVTIGNTANARAGFYKDIITLTIGTPP